MTPPRRPKPWAETNRQGRTRYVWRFEGQRYWTNFYDDPEEARADATTQITEQLEGSWQERTGRRILLATSVFGLARVNPDGTLDSAFGSGGTLTTTFNGDEGVGALVVQPDGKIIAVGFSENNTTGHVFIALARYNG